MFSLLDYEKEIRAGATKASISNEDALKRFIFNLTTLKPYYDHYANNINFRILGQQWNAQTSDIRNQQKTKLLDILSKVPRTRINRE